MGPKAAERSRQRLDTLLVARGLMDSRAKAAAAILAGEVFLNGERATKPGQQPPPDALVELRSRRPRFVGRGGEKLEHALRALGVSVAGTAALDVGSSTGGFTDCLLQHGARRVYAVDVGTGQLAWSLRRDPRVVSMERQDIRTVALEDIGAAVEVATVDVAFISLAKVLPAVARLVRPGGSIVALVKPQFEVGPKAARRGVVRDDSVHRQVLVRVLADAQDAGLSSVAVTYSPIAGPQGNLEFFVLLRRGGPVADLDVDAVVAQAHQTVPRRARDPRR